MTKSKALAFLDAHKRKFEGINYVSLRVANILVDIHHTLDTCQNCQHYHFVNRWEHYDCKKLNLQNVEKDFYCKHFTSKEPHEHF